MRFQFQSGNQFARGNGANRTSFKRGLAPWNRGRKGLVSEKSLATVFRKGQQPHNFVPVGTLTIRIDTAGKQRRWIKTSAGWAIYSIWLWSQTNGPVPRGSVIHSDGDTLNDQVSNYERMTRAEHMRCHRSEIQAAKEL